MLKIVAGVNNILAFKLTQLVDGHVYVLGMRMVAFIPESSLVSHNTSKLRLSKLIGEILRFINLFGVPTSLAPLHL